MASARPALRAAKVLSLARSAINESAALTDPTGLGSFLVLEWRV